MNFASMNFISIFVKTFLNMSEEQKNPEFNFSKEFQTHESLSLNNSSINEPENSENEPENNFFLKEMTEEEEKTIFAEWQKAEEEYKQEWEKAKQSVITLIEPKYFEFAEDHDYFHSEGIVEIKETEERTSGYSDYRHCRTADNDGKLYMLVKTSIETVKEDSEFEGQPIEYWVWQTTGYMGDDYSGFLLLPLSDGRFWKIGYSC